MTSRDDRIEGVLLATAAGDALGAPYEFQPPRGPELDVTMSGGGVWAAGEWTDDTAMAIAIAEVAGTGVDLREEAAQDAIVSRWLEWSRGAKDVGIQTGSVLRSARIGSEITAERARSASTALHQGSGRTAGNGSLMRTAPVALAYLDDEQAMVEAARSISELTHFDPDAGDACLLWCSAIRHAVLTGELNVRVGLRHLTADRRELWSARLDAAEAGGRRTSRATDGWCRLCKRRGRRSRSPLCLRMIRLRRCFALIICGCRSTRRCGPGSTPTRWRRSPAVCSEQPMAHRPFPWNGGRSCTAGRIWIHMGW